MMYDDVGRWKEVTHCHTDVVHRTLGVMLAPDDNNKSQVKRMRQIFSKFGDRVRAGYIQGEDLLLILTSTVMRSLAWPLPEITLTNQQ